MRRMAMVFFRGADGVVAALKPVPSYKAAGWARTIRESGRTFLGIHYYTERLLD